jgi:hypothetical protein
MRTANFSVAGLSLLLWTSGFAASASPSVDTVVTKTITIDHIIKMKVVGNIDLVLIKSDADKAEIKGASNLVAGLTLQNDSENMLISEKTADRHTRGRIKITLWLRNPNIQSMSCTGGSVTVTNG